VIYRLAKHKPKPATLWTNIVTLYTLNRRMDKLTWLYKYYKYYI
jgi:hypothetical protein